VQTSLSSYEIPNREGGIIGLQGPTPRGIARGPNACLGRVHGLIERQTPVTGDIKPQRSFGIARRRKDVARQAVLEAGSFQFVNGKPGLIYLVLSRFLTISTLGLPMGWTVAITARGCADGAIFLVEIISAVHPQVNRCPITISIRGVSPS